MVKFNDGIDDYYLAAAGRLYIREVLTGSWTVVAPPAGLANAMCNTLELFSGAIHAGFYNSSTGAGYGLYTAPQALPLNWTIAAETDAQNVQITLLKDVGGQLFVATNTGANVNTLYYGNSTALTAVSVPTPATDIAFIDVAQASFDSSYWVLAGPYLYQSAAPLPGTFTEYPGTAPAPDSPLSGYPAAPVSGGLFDDGSALYVSAGNGRLYRTADGGTTWTWTTTAFKDDSGDNTTRFTAFAAPGADVGAVYVGTQSQGYRRIPSGDVTGTAGTLTREPAFNITALYNGSLNFLFYDAANLRLLLGTNGSGLWRGDHAGGSTWTWKQE
jgi:hypothetical protein